MRARPGEPKFHFCNLPSGNARASRSTPGTVTNQGGVRLEPAFNARVIARACDEVRRSAHAASTHGSDGGSRAPSAVLPPSSAPLTSHHGTCSGHSPAAWLCNMSHRVSAWRRIAVDAPPHAPLLPLDWPAPAVIPARPSRARDSFRTTWN